MQKLSHAIVSLKVHKIENCIGFDFEICTISLLVMSNIKILQKNFLFVPLLEELRFFRVVLGLRRMKKNFEGGSKIFVWFFF